MNRPIEYLYTIQSRREFNELSKMEITSIFGVSSNQKYILSTDDVSLSRSGFLGSKITILYRTSSFEQLEQQILQDQLHVDDYKIQFIKIDPVDYHERLEILRRIGFAIEGTFAIKDPKVSFAITTVNNEWLFGYYEKNKHEWLIRKHKPYNYSSALDIVLAKALINIAIQNDFSKQLVDPCCGIGTVIIEGRIMGISIEGYEMNPLVKHHCNANLEHFGMNPDVRLLDMHNITKHYDAAILDLPYGQYSIITLTEQLALVRKAAAIAPRVIILSMNDISVDLLNLGLHITEQCEIKKSNVFSRYVYHCITT